MSREEPSQAALFDVFSNARRRYTVKFLSLEGGETQLTPLVHQVAAWENDTTTDEVTRTQRRRVYISLYQTHLPMLDDHGIVDWDAEEHAISLLHDPEIFEAYLDRSIGRRRHWHRLYGSVAIVSAVVLVLTLLSIGPLTVGVAPIVAAGLSGSVLILATLHHRERTHGGLRRTIDGVVSTVLPS